MSNFNFRQVGGARVYRSWKNWEEGDTLIGKFQKQFEDNYGNPGYEVEVIETDFHNGENIEQGKVIGLNSCGSLNYKMEEVQLGSVIRVEYNGTDIGEKGPYKGKEFHDVSLDVDDTTVVATATPVEESEESYDL